MSCKVSVRQAGFVSIVDLVGRVTFGESVGQMRDTLQNLAEGGAKNILVNLQGASYLDSSALSELVAAHICLTNAGGRIKLLHPQSMVKRVLQITRLYTVFETYEDEALALQSFTVEAASA